MFPIRDNIPSNSTPFVMYGIILLNAFIFYQEMIISDSELEKMMSFSGLVPFDFMQGLSANPANLFLYMPLVTNLFLHGGWLHIIGNMWYLKIFGDNIEDRMGHGIFFLFYILCGVVANVVQILIDPSSHIPTIGASGAISGVLGAYLVSFPSAKVSTVVFLFIFFTVIDIPALLFLGLWFFMQLQSGAASLNMVGTNVAWWAHVGGFLAGMILVNLFPKR